MLADRVRIGRKKGGGKYIGEVYLAQDDDFVKVNNRWIYRGSELEIEIPHVIQGEEITFYTYMFSGTGNYLATPVTRVDSNSKRITNMSNMFNGSSATTLDLSSFDTSNVTAMSNMFRDSNATTLDLSSFDTSKVTSMSSMFNGSSATTGYARTQADADRFNNSSNKPSALVFVARYDDSGSPGNNMLIAGTMQEGFFGEVSASEFITGDSLASQVGMSQGTSMNSTVGWLKFAYKGEILFVAKKPIRHTISWNILNDAKCIYGDSGDKTVVIEGITYKVTLMRGLEPSNDPKIPSGTSSGEIVHNSEWNRLMCQIHEEAINKNWKAPANIESDIGILEHSLGSGIQGMYNDVDLTIRYNQGDGSRGLCQEKYDTTRCIMRGHISLSDSNARYNTSVTNSEGWRPVLRLMRGD